MKKILYIILTLVIIAGGYYFYDRSQKLVKAPTEDLGVETLKTQSKEAAENNLTNENRLTPASPDTQPKAPSEIPVTGTFSTGEENSEGADVSVVEVIYNGTEFIPGDVDIRVNDYIFFKNESAGNFWPASAQHPSHTDYPEFDSKKPIASGMTFKFQFTKAGTWKFHDHLNPSAAGVINVK